jgi:hypothetical protein
MHGRDEKCTLNFVGKPEEKRSLTRPGHGWMIILKWILGK